MVPARGDRHGSYRTGGDDHIRTADVRGHDTEHVRRVHARWHGRHHHALRQAQHTSTTRSSRSCRFRRGGPSRMVQRDVQYRASGTRAKPTHVWARDDFCATVGAVDAQTVMAYHESQRGIRTMKDSTSQRPPSLQRLSAGAAPGGVSRNLTFLEIGDDRLEPIVVQRSSPAGVAMPASVVRYCLS
jgi:hypothetical protein